MALFPGWRLHQLKGARRGEWSIWVTGNFRLTFRLVGQDVTDIDLEDYHRKIAMPMRNPPHVGRVIQNAILDPLDLSITKAADVLGVRRATLSDLINGKSDLTAEMALRIHKAFGPDVDHLLRMQLAYDVARVRKRAGQIKVKRYVSKAA